MNRRGVDFMVLLLVAIIICLIALYIELQKKVELDRVVIGQHQSAVLNSFADRRKVDLFVEGAAEFSLRVAFSRVQARNGFEGAPCGGVWSSDRVLDGELAPLGRDCAVVNTPEKPKEVCVPELTSFLRRVFNEEMNKYAELYAQRGVVSLPKDNYEVFAGDEFLAVARSPVVIDVKKLQSGMPIGQVGWRPSVALPQSNVLQPFKDAFEVLSRVAVECHGVPAPAACVRGKVPSGWQVRGSGAEVALVVPNARSCFGLQLVPQVVEGFS